MSSNEITIISIDDSTTNSPVHDVRSKPKDRIHSIFSKAMCGVVITFVSLCVFGHLKWASNNSYVTIDEDHDMVSRSRRLQVEDLTGFKDNWSPLEAHDRPVFWHIPKSGGSSVKNYLGSCYGKVLASEAGIQGDHDHDTRLKIVRSKGNNRFVNVDTTTTEGIRRALEMGFATSRLADVTVSPLLHEVESLFSRQNPGRVFAIFRDPIDRAISMFSYLQYAEWEPTFDEQFRTMTLDDYARSELIEDNMLTRILVNKKRGPLSDSDVTAAADVIRRKILVGLMSNIDASLDRFERFFEWQFHDTVVQEACRKNVLTLGGNANKKKTEKPQPGSPTYEALAAKNQYDLRLYSYIQKLFTEQECFVQQKPSNYRLLPA